jgi:hypothetical protein
MRQTYGMSDEQADLTLFLSGAPQPENYNDDWHAYIRSHVTAGKTVQRVKLIRRPYTDYTRFLMEWGVPGNVAAGEDYRIIDVSQGEHVELPDQDFWLFDEKLVIRLDFDEAGGLSGIERIEQPDLDHYRQVRDAGLRQALPFRDWHAGA